MRAFRRMLAVLAMLCLIVSRASAGPYSRSSTGSRTGDGSVGEQVPRSVDPYRWRLSKEDPEAKIPVIVQLQQRGHDTAKLARDHGGSLKDSFKFINGFRMELPAAAVARLGTNPAVRYVSVDAAAIAQAIDTSSLQTIYNQVAGSVAAWVLPARASPWRCWTPASTPTTT
jgi:S-adenosylmethionine:tRNA-ribosyltransferase-isomerase (queuine synthetase)